MTLAESLTQTFNKLDLYLFSLVILGILTYKTHRNEDRNTAQSRLFRLLLALNATLLIIDGLSTGLDGFKGKNVRCLLEYISVINLSLQTLTAYVWIRFVREVTRAKNRYGKASELIMALPLILVLLMLFSSPFTGLGFYYDQNNRYTRTIGSYFVILTDFAYILMAYVVAIKARHSIDRKKYIALISFAVAPAVGGLSQVFFPAIALVWPASTISLLVSYLAVQNEQLFLDHLTGINNRRSLDLALRRKINEVQGNGIFGLILIDLDDFKSINDTYGHLEGDHALEAASRILRKSFHHRDFLSRYGGDEFLVIADLKTPSDLISIERRLDEQFQQWNASSGTPWKLAFSIGYAAYGPALSLSPDQCLREIDKLLYERKRMKKGDRAADKTLQVLN